MAFFPSREIVLQLGPLAIHWYGIMYLCAFLVVWWMIPRLQKYRGLALNDDQLSNLLTYGILGTLLGGRLGFVFFYAPYYFAQHPLEIFAVWQGGMSSHGGFIGVTLGVLLFCYQNKVSFLRVADILVVPAAIGLACGRIGNFINLELYGIPTDLPWGIAIPGVEALRHPTQIYAVLKNVLIAACCFVHVRSFKWIGTTLGLFLVLYGTLRYLVEFLRVQDVAHTTLFGIDLTRGQLLTIPVLLTGLLLLVLRTRKDAS